MRIQLGLLKTRVARRILFLFLLCAVLPVSVLSFISYHSVRSQLLDESRERLGEISKNAGLALAERFQFLENTARLVLFPMAQGQAAGTASPASVPQTSAGMEGFEAALVVSPGQEPRGLFGEMRQPDTLSQEERAHLATGFPLVRLVYGTDGAPQILMAVDMDGGSGSPSVLWTRLHLDFLWSTASGYSTLPSTAGLCIMGEAEEPLFCTLPDVDAFLGALATHRASTEDESRARGYQVLEWKDDSGEDYIAAIRDLFLRSQFFLPGLTVSVSEYRSNALLAMETFRSGFWGVIALGLVAVALLSNFQIRKSLGPLEELQKGTQRLAAGNFEERVSVSSRDEFEELADSFNGMAAHLQSQFHALETIGDIDRAILSALDSNRIVETILLRAGDLLQSDQAAVCRLEWLGSREGRLWVSRSGTGRIDPDVRVILSEEDLAFLSATGEAVLLDTAESASQYFGGGAGVGGVTTAILVPLILPEGLAGFLAVGRNGGAGFSETDLDHTGQIGKQLSIALANARLLEEIERMSWGALTALARAVDAKSPWTSGHSERVAVLSVAIGRHMGLPESSLTNLQRGGLVHDIGKIAVPGRILDKNGKLTEEERQVIQSHPEAGVRILEPISAMEAILPLVLYHHEAWDGSGYPTGLAGEAIPLEARIMAVADHFDAMNSDRPYRKGFGLEKTVGILREVGGEELDPDIVRSFVDLVETGGLPTLSVSSMENTP